MSSATFNKPNFHLNQDKMKGILQGKMKIPLLELFSIHLWRLVCKKCVSQGPKNVLFRSLKYGTSLRLVFVQRSSKVNYTITSVS